jgi:hypothetical protein
VTDPFFVEQLQPMNGFGMSGSQLQQTKIVTRQLDARVVTE